MKGKLALDVCPPGDKPTCPPETHQWDNTQTANCGPVRHTCFSLSLKYCISTYGLTVVTLSCACANRVYATVLGRAYYALSAEGEGGCGGGGSLAVVPRESDEGPPARALCME